MRSGPAASAARKPGSSPGARLDYRDAPAARSDGARQLCHPPVRPRPPQSRHRAHEVLRRRQPDAARSVTVPQWRRARLEQHRAKPDTEHPTPRCRITPRRSARPSPRPAFPCDADLDCAVRDSGARTRRAQARARRAGARCARRRGPVPPLASTSSARHSSANISKRDTDLQTVRISLVGTHSARS